MSITRYAADEQPHHDDRGPWVLYAEHLVVVEALIAENAEETAQYVKPIYVDAWDGMAVPYDDHVVAVEAAHAAGMREALADFLTSIDEDDPVYLRGRADAARDVAALGMWSLNSESFISVAFGIRLVPLDKAITAARGDVDA